MFVINQTLSLNKKINGKSDQKNHAVYFNLQYEAEKSDSYYDVIK